MRQASASVAKGRNSPSSNIVPKEGTHIRQMYDYLMARKGEVIDEPLSYFNGAPKPKNTQAISQLRDFYGLDIRNLGYRKWVLAGEWFDTAYRDYVSDRFDGAAQ